ncbi:MAG: alpha/beta hydrolase [Nocardioides sp.]
MTEEALRTVVDGEVVVVRLPDPEGAASAVRLWSDLELGDTAFTPVEGGWELRLADLPVDLLEYMIDVDDDLQIDATNPQTVDGAFGAHSWVSLSGYRPPAWLDAPRVEGESRELRIDDVDVVLWEPPDAEHLLLAHDGPEMAAYGGLLGFVAASIAAGTIPPTRVALLDPGPRNERYSANPKYAATLSDAVVPELLAAAPTRADPVVLGQSLGGVAALHAAWTSPSRYAGLLLQSGSFFTPELDEQESDFECWDDVTGFVASLLAATQAAPDAPAVTMTCGSAEENFANNRLMRDHLISTGLDVAWGETRQAHTWTCWRDLLDPHLTDLLRRVWP